MKRIFEVQPWNIVTHDFKPADKRLQESMTSLGNGYMGMRGFFEEDYSGDTLPGTYLGGVWYPDKTRVGWWKNGYPKYFGKVINAINFIKMNFLINGEQMDLARDQFTDFELNLDLKHAKLTRTFIVAKGSTRIKFNFERFLSVAQKELAMQRVSFENIGEQSVELTIISAVDSQVQNEDANYDEHFWRVLTINPHYLIAQTKPNEFGTPQFTTGVQVSHKTTLVESTPTITDAEIQHTFKTTLIPGQSENFEKRAVVVTSRDYTTQAALTTAMGQIMETVSKESYDQLATDHEAIWAERWAQSDVKIQGDIAAQQGMRFNLFGLFTTYYGDDARLNFGPKGFTGEKYGGATYWDTEAFCVPVYLGITQPTVTKNLLRYRYHQLAGAYVNAKEQGLKGALFPMVTFNGIECHNEWEITFEEIHRNSDIAFAIYNYTKYTGDQSYVLHEGSEVLTEIARFWADRVHYSQRKGQYMIHGVTGPDEYENNVDNNWYTNYLARWTLEYTLKIIDLVSDEQAQKLAITGQERQHWQAIVDKMYLPYDTELGIFEQHDGFLDKDLTPVSEIPVNQRPINQNWSWDKILRSPYIKQGDVIQGIWNFIDDFSIAEKKRNFDFYEPLTVHESSLSPAVYSIIAADLHYEDKAVELYERTARLDLDNYNNDTDDGLHITAMTGGWLSIVHGFAGMRVNDAGELSYKPFLPKKWESYSFRQVFRNRVIEIIVDQTGTQVKLIEGAPLTIRVNGQKQLLENK